MIVVTGAAGFIGSNIVAALNAGGRKDVVAVDYFLPAAVPAGLANNPAYLDSLAAVRRIGTDELKGWLAANASAVDAVIHMGACSDTAQTDEAFMMACNFEYTRMIWEFCAAAGRPLVYASSAATYGDGSAGYDDKIDPRVFKPLNLYGLSKQRFDLWALEQAKAPPRWAGVKFFNVYGPRESHKGRMASVAFHSYNQIRRTAHVELFKSHRPDYPDGGQKRDFIHVDDAAAAVLHLLETPASAAAPNGLYNVGTGTARTFADLAKAVFVAMKFAPNISYIPMPPDIRDKYQYFTQADVARLRQSGFVRPMLSIEAGAKKYVEWLNRQGGRA
ncbi:MAG: ADP-glyceromanno-heptose 6-epimerase [Planctomycetes bacterium]|nr:ADP-glyceromanno-heptose 6-epimerase [Planctomycetota bacterium]